MTILKTIYSAGALFGSSGIPGIVLDGVTDNFAVTSCAADTVVIGGTEANNLEPGQILVNLGDGSDDSPCTPCSPLFRKVETLTYLDGTAFTTTTFATFSEVFPEGVYDETLANTPIEPLFKCEHSQSKRKLSDNGNADANFIFCQVVIFSYITAFCFGLVIPPLAAVLWPLLILLGNTSEVCGLANFVTVYEFFFPNLVDPNSVGSSSDSEDFVTDAAGADVPDEADISTVLKPEPYVPNEANTTAAPKPETDGDATRKLQEEVVFPGSCKEWIAKDAASGKCSFVDCNVGANGNAADCYNKEVDITGICHSPDMIDITGVLGFSDEACCMQEYCYSSTFGKGACDAKIHKVITSNCASTKGAMAMFPLETSVLNQNCHMMAALFYLGSKVFGRHSHNMAQAKQIEYNREAFCSPVNEMKF